MTGEKTTTRRRYSRGFKVQVMAECDVPGASVAKVAMSHGINANVVHGWRKLARVGGMALQSAPHEFVPVSLEPASPQPTAHRGIEVELRRGALTMKITWPQSAAADFAAWTRDLLR
jgi:transposase